MGNMNLLTKLKLGNNAALILKDKDQFPANPEGGQLAMENGILFAYSTIDGVTTWFPLNNRKTIYTHQQVVPSTVWTIEHNFATTDFLYMVYDSDHNLIQANNNLVDPNTFTIDFTEATTGMVVVVFDADSFTVALETSGLQDDLALKAPLNSPTFTGTVGGITKAMVGLSDVDNTADLAKPVSTAQQTAIDLKADIASPVFTGPVTGDSFNSITGLSSAAPIMAGTTAVGTATTAARADHVHPVQTSVSGNAGSADVLSSARTINGVSFNGSANIVVNAVDSTARIAVSEKGAPLGVATLDEAGLIPSGQLPSYVDDVLEYANLAAFPVTGETGKIYLAIDTNKTYRWSGSTYVFITSGAVDSVAGKTGVVTLVKADVGLTNVDNTSDINKPVSTTQQTALDLKANIASPTFTGTVGGITKSMVGLDSVDNTADSAKPVSTAQQTAINAAVQAILSPFLLMGA